MNNCNCDEGYLCEFCENDPVAIKERDDYCAQMLWEFQRYVIKNENNELVDVRDKK